jgi:hypothetical protein
MEAAFKDTLRKLTFVISAEPMTISRGTEDNEFLTPVKVHLELGGKESQTFKRTWEHQNQQTLTLSLLLTIYFTVVN